MTRVAAGLVAVALSLQPMTYRNTRMPADQRVDDLLWRMTLEEKTGQPAVFLQIVRSA